MTPISKLTPIYSSQGVSVVLGSDAFRSISQVEGIILSKDSSDLIDSLEKFGYTYDEIRKIIIERHKPK